MWRPASLTVTLRRTGGRSLLSSTGFHPRCRRCSRLISSAPLQHESSVARPPLPIAHVSPAIISTGSALSNGMRSLHPRRFSTSRQPGDDIQITDTKSPSTKHEVATSHSNQTDAPASIPDDGFHLPPDTVTASTPGSVPLPPSAAPPSRAEPALQLYSRTISLQETTTPASTEEELHVTPQNLAGASQSTDSTPTQAATTRPATTISQQATAQDLAASSSSTPAIEAHASEAQATPPGSTPTSSSASEAPCSAPAPSVEPTPTPAAAKPATEAPGSADKPFDPRDFCCMSGCVDCVLYDDAFGTPGKAGEVEMDPAMKAFLEMEQRMAKLKQ